MSIIINKSTATQIIIITFLAICYLSTAYASTSPNRYEQKTPAPLAEELQWLQAESIVYTASRKEQKLSETAAAVFTISHDDLRRSGVTNIPDALRMAPGIEVAKINSNSWAISIRGHNDRFADKLLVLLDGRALYTPFFSGVIWHTKDTLLEDVERIEVIRGPGAALWGSNAVNGIINIITKHTQDTQEGLLSAGGGNEEKGFGSFRYGDKINNIWTYRGYGKYLNKDDSQAISGEETHDQWDFLQGGFRIDGTPSKIDSFTLQGDIYDGNGGSAETVIVPTPPYATKTKVDYRYSGGNLLGRWDRDWTDTSNTTLQVYYDQTYDQFNYADEFYIMVQTFDLDFQHRFMASNRHEITWGTAFRSISDQFKNSSNLQMTTTSSNTKTYSAFVQDEITLIDNKLTLILGSKLEHNYYTQWEIQPNARLLWDINNTNTIWAAISKAVRTPNRILIDLQALYFDPFQLPANALGPGSPAATALFMANGTTDFDSEDLLAYEIGYRTSPTDQLNFDITAFYYEYDSLKTIEPGVPSLVMATPPHFIFPVLSDNKGYAESYGVELLAEWLVLPTWRLMGSYSYYKLQLHEDADSQNLRESFSEKSPENQLKLTSTVDLPMNTNLTISLRYVDAIPLFNYDSYIEMDTRIGWQPMPNIEMSLVGRNLFNSSHPEFRENTLNIVPSEEERSVHGQVTWKF